MVKIVILGSCRHAPYEILAAPDPLPGCGNDEAGYREACKKFYPAIDKADLVLVYAPDGRIGEHTVRDMDYAISKQKNVSVIPLTEQDLIRQILWRQRLKRSRRVPSPSSAESAQTARKEGGDTP
jgi:hypothetical protein